MFAGVTSMNLYTIHSQVCYSVCVTAKLFISCSVMNVYKLLNNEHLQVVE